MGAKGVPGPGASTSLRRTSVPQALSLPVTDIPMSSSRVVKHEIVLPCDGDFMSICFGGQASPYRNMCLHSIMWKFHPEGL